MDLFGNILDFFRDNFSDDYFNNALYCESFDTLDTFKSFFDLASLNYLLSCFLLLLLSDKVFLLLLKMISAPWDQNNTISLQINKKQLIHSSIYFLRVFSQKSNLGT